MERPGGSRWNQNIEEQVVRIDGDKRSANKVDNSASNSMSVFFNTLLFVIPHRFITLAP